MHPESSKELIDADDELILKISEKRQSVGVLKQLSHMIKCPQNKNSIKSLSLVACLVQCCDVLC